MWNWKLKKENNCLFHLTCLNLEKMSQRPDRVAESAKNHVFIVIKIKPQEKTFSLIKSFLVRFILLFQICSGKNWNRKMSRNFSAKMKQAFLWDVKNSTCWKERLKGALLSASTLQCVLTLKSKGTNKEIKNQKRLHVNFFVCFLLYPTVFLIFVHEVVS